MARDLTAGMVTAATAAEITPVFFQYLGFDSGAVRLFTGAGELSWDGETWLGGGDLIGLSLAEETSALSAAGGVLSMSGIPSSLLSIALAEDYQERVATTWLAAFDTSVSPPVLIADPYQILSARMDVMSIDEGAETSSIAMAVENVLISLEEARQRRYTAEDQKNEFPGDTLFDMVPALQDADVIWGKGS